jgi:hypothetical protein
MADEEFGLEDLLLAPLPSKEAVQVATVLSHTRKWGGKRNAELIAAKIIVNSLEVEGFQFLSDGNNHYIVNKDFYLYDAEVIDIESAFFCDLILSFISIDLQRKGDESIWRFINSEIRSKSKKVKLGKFAFKEDRNNADYVYVSRFDGYMYRLDGQEIKEVKNGTDGVCFFKRPGCKWEPYKINRRISKKNLGIWDQFIKFPNFSLISETGLTRNEQRNLFEKWLLSLFFINQSGEKPILLNQGPAESGKTAVLELVLMMLFGNEVKIRQMPGDKKSFIAGVNADFIVTTHTLIKSCHR